MIRHIILILAVTVAFLCVATLAGAQSSDEIVVRSAEEILKGQETNPSREAIRELFVNGSSRDELHAPVAKGCKAALVKLGMTVIPPLIEDYISSTDLLKNIAIDDIVTAAGTPAMEYLIPYLGSEDSYTRRHAAYLIGTVCAASRLTDPFALGPVEEDKPAIAALDEALKKETDWHAIQGMIGALGSMKDPGMIDSLAEYMKNDEQALRVAAVQAIGKIPSEKSIEPLISVFDDPMMNVRESSIYALATPVMMKFGFERVCSEAIQSRFGEKGRLCALETMARYLEGVAMDESEEVEKHRQTSFQISRNVIESWFLESDSGKDPGWRVYGFAVTVIGYTWQPEAMMYLVGLHSKNENPFVLGKIEEAIERLREGRKAARPSPA